MEDLARVDNLRRPGEPHPRAGARAVDGAQHFVVEGAIAAETVVKAAFVLEELRELLLELGDDVALVGTELRLRAVQARPRTVPDLALGIARAHEQRSLLVVATQDQRALRLVEAGDVEEVRVLTVLVVDVAISRKDRGRREHGHGVAVPTLGHRLAERGTSPREELAIAVAHGDLRLAPTDLGGQGRTRGVVRLARGVLGRVWAVCLASGGQEAHNRRMTPNDQDRRKQRSLDPLVALHYQLAQTKTYAAVEAIVLADASGVVVAGAGSWVICEELAAYAPLFEHDDVPARVATLRAECDVRSVKANGQPMLLCAMGKSAARAQAAEHASKGVARILETSL